ncbi:hypothetical protein GCM10009838_87390 [Catenulispora subtropica]|uniref:Uncharacterized protein n=1 Tax=Catenulispora subtropica TaxID=450798 RepID=A0ABP5ETN9_9ACTN
MGAPFGAVVEVNGRSVASRIHTDGPPAATACGALSAVSDNADSARLTRRRKDVLGRMRMADSGL